MQVVLPIGSLCQIVLRIGFLLVVACEEPEKRKRNVRLCT